MKSAIVLVLTMALAMSLALGTPANAAEVTEMSTDDIRACVEKSGPQHSSVQTGVPTAARHRVNAFGRCIVP